MINTDSFTTAWIAYYDNGTATPSIYNSVNHTLVDLPDDGFQAMRLWYHNGTGRYISGNDYYFFSEHPSGLIFGQTNDSYESIVERYPNAIIKRGKHTSEEMIHYINNLMITASKPI
jgi:hypothetical protein